MFYFLQCKSAKKKDEGHGAAVIFCFCRCRCGTLHAFHFNLISAAFCFHLAPAKGHLASWQRRTRCPGLVAQDSRVSRMCGMCNNLNYAHETWLPAHRTALCDTPPATFNDLPKTQHSYSGTRNQHNEESHCNGDARGDADNGMPIRGCISELECRERGIEIALSCRGIMLLSRSKMFDIFICNLNE